MALQECIWECPHPIGHPEGKGLSSLHKCYQVPGITGFPRLGAEVQALGRQEGGGWGSGALYHFSPWALEAPGPVYHRGVGGGQIAAPLPPHWAVWQRSSQDLTYLHSSTSKVGM